MTEVDIQIPVGKVKMFFQSYSEKENGISPRWHMFVLLPA